MKKCSYCAEEIQDDAIKCRYCREQLQEALPSENKAKSSGLFGSIALVAFLMSAFVPALIAPLIVLVALCSAALEIKQGSKVYGGIVLALSLFQVWAIMDHFGGISASLGLVNVKEVEEQAITKYKNTSKDLPADALQIVQQECAKQWPDDYRMRSYCEGRQREGMAKLDKNKPSDVSDEAFTIIRGKCANEWPRDFSMRAYCETQQYDGYRSLQQSESSGRDAVRTRCAQKWPDDYRMRVYCESRGG